MAQGACRRWRRSNRAGGIAEGACALPAESEPRRRRQSLLLRHGRNAARGFGRRFYIICEADRSFRAVPSGHGSGRNVAGVNFSNGIQCAKNFSNAMDSKLTTGGPYVTAEIRTSFKGYYRSAGKYVAFSRSFVQFDGEGDTANARPRAIGGHPAAVLRIACRRKAPESPYANEEGYVPVGTLQDYAAGRSNGCTSWSQSDAAKIIPMMQEPSTLYIYPESGDIAAVAQAVKAGRSPSRAGLYWNASCLREIRISEILAKGNPRAGPHSIQEEPSGSAAAATADLQGAVKSALLHDMPEAA